MKAPKWELNEDGSGEYIFNPAYKGNDVQFSIFLSESPIIRAREIQLILSALNAKKEA